MEDMHQIIDLVVEAGKTMIESGSEIYRGEETMIRIAHSFNIDQIDIFTLSTCIYVTCVVDGDTYTRIKRIYPKSTDLSIISQVNQLSRNHEMYHYSMDEFKDNLDEIKHSRKPKKIIVASTMALTCAVFAFMLQNCGLNDFLCTAVISFLAYYVLDYFNHFKFHMLFKNFFVTMFISILAVGCVDLGIGVNIDNMIIGSIMMLVPGVATTNAVRDLLMGDILSGTIRVIEAVTVAIGIAMAVGLVLYCRGVLMGVM